MPEPRLVGQIIAEYLTAKVSPSYLVASTAVSPLSLLANSTPYPATAMAP